MRTEETPTRLHVPGLSGGTFYYPEFLPDGKNLLFAWAADADVEATIYLATVEDGKVKRGPFPLLKNATAGHYSPARGGRLLYVRDDKLYAQKIDVAHGKLEGAPERVMDEVFSRPGTRHAQFSVSRDDVLVWRSGRASLARMTWFDRTGKAARRRGPSLLPRHDPSVSRREPCLVRKVRSQLSRGRGQSGWLPAFNGV